jgi:hypothetical protein
MVRPQVKVDESRSWALGWQIYHDKSGDLIQHGGGFIIMTNGENGWTMITTPALGEVMTRLMMG